MFTYRCAAPAAVPHQIVIQQHQNLIGMQELRLIVNDTQAVRVAVGGDADVAAVFFHIVRQARQRLEVGRGQPAAEQRVPPLMDDLYVAPGGEQDGLQRCLGHAVHGV